MSNLLEHVDNPLDFIGYISEISREGCILILTSPYKYPIHMDPGDNNFRPSPNELAKLFSEFAVKESKIIVIDPEYKRLVKRPKLLVILVVRCLLPMYKPSGWITAVNRLFWIFRTKQISCVILQKVSRRTA